MKYRYALLGLGALLIIGATIFLFGSGGQKVLVLSTTPVNVPPHEVRPDEAHYDHAVWGTGEITIPEDIWVTSLTAEVSGISPDNMHDFYVFKLGTQDQLCPENPEALWVGGTVSVRSSTFFPAPYGIFLKKGERVQVHAMFHNPATGHAHGAYTDVSLTVRLGYKDAGATDRTVPLLFQTIGIRVCDIEYPFFRIPAKTEGHVVAMEKPFRFKEDSTVIMARGHFHSTYDDGVRNTLRILRNNKVIDEFTTFRISDGRERNPRMLEGLLPLQVARGDALSLEAIFDNPSSAFAPEGMALMGFYYYTP